MELIENNDDVHTMSALCARACIVGSALSVNGLDVDVDVVK